MTNCGQIRITWIRLGGAHTRLSDQTKRRADVPHQDRKEGLKTSVGILAGASIGFSGIIRDNPDGTAEFTCGFFSLLEPNMEKGGPLIAVLNNPSYCPGYDVMRWGPKHDAYKQPELAEETQRELKLCMWTVRER